MPEYGSYRVREGTTVLLVTNKWSELRDKVKANADGYEAGDIKVEEFMRRDPWVRNAPEHPAWRDMLPTERLALEISARVSSPETVLP